MSYDLLFASKPCPHCGHVAARGDYNVTWNLSPMLDLLLDNVDPGSKGHTYSWHRLKGRPLAELGPLLLSMLAELRKRPEVYQQLNPSNGWGSYDGLLKVVERMVQDAAELPEDAELQVCS